MKVIKQCPESVFITGEHIRVLQNIINPGLLAEIILFLVIKNRDFVRFINNTRNAIVDRLLVACEVVWWLGKVFDCSLELFLDD